MVSLLTSRCPLKGCGSFREGFDLLLSSASHRSSQGVSCYCLGQLKLPSDNSVPLCIRDKCLVAMENQPARLMMGLGVT